MSLFDRLARVAKGKALLWTQGGSSGPDDAAVRAELEALRPPPIDAERGPAQATARGRPPDLARPPIAPRHDPADRPVPRTDLLGEPERAPRPESAPKKDL